MNAGNLTPPKNERVFSALQIVVFSIIVAVMLLFISLLIYQWINRPVPYVSAMPLQTLFTNVV